MTPGERRTARPPRAGTEEAARGPEIGKAPEGRVPADHAARAVRPGIELPFPAVRNGARIGKGC
jgi:hypothetical protein